MLGLCSPKFLPYQSGLLSGFYPIDLDSQKETQELRFFFLPHLLRQVPRRVRPLHAHDPLGRALVQHFPTAGAAFGAEVDQPDHATAYPV